MKAQKYSDMRFDAGSDEDAPNRAVYATAKKSEGRLRLYRILLFSGYVLFSAGFFAFCYVNALIPVVAVLPLLLFIIHGFTWRYVSYDVVWQFEGGSMIFGRIYGRNTHRIYKPMLEVRLADGVLCGPAELSKCEDAYNECDRKWDFSSSKKSPDACVLIWRDAEGRYCGVRFDAISKVARLLKSFCPGTDFTGKEFRF